MKYTLGLGFIGGLVLGGLAGAMVALLFAPSSGEATRDQIRSEGIALKNRGQAYGNDRVHDAQKMMQQGQKSASQAQARLGGAIEDQKDHVKEALGVAQ